MLGEGYVAGFYADALAVGELDDEGAVGGYVYGGSFDAVDGAVGDDGLAEVDETPLPFDEGRVVAGDCGFVEGFEVVTEVAEELLAVDGMARRPA